jgi:hypothetical protein
VSRVTAPLQQEIAMAERGRWRRLAVVVLFGLSTVDAGTTLCGTAYPAAALL